MSVLLFVGLGRIGLPQSLVFAQHGHIVYGYDEDPALVGQLNKGQAPFHEPRLDELLNKHVGKGFLPVDDWRPILPRVDTVMIALGTAAPDSASCLSDHGRGDLDGIIEVVAGLLDPAAGASPGLLVVFRTTLPLGSVDIMRAAVEQRHGLVEGRDFHFAFVPERLVEGQAIAEEEALPKIVGTYSDTTFERVAALLGSVGGRVIRVRDPLTAEFCKLTDNAYRSTMFAFSNDLALLASRLGLDAAEIVAAVNADYGRNRVPRPGFVSGYCLTKDPYLLEYRFKEIADERGTQSVWYYGRRANDHLVEHAAERIAVRCAALGIVPQQATVCVLGLSFKEDVDDFRMSHSVLLVERLLQSGFSRLRCYDPALGHSRYAELPGNLAEAGVTAADRLEPAFFKEAQVVVVAHRHQSIVAAAKSARLGELLASASRPCYVFDGWDVWRAAGELAGVFYESLGWAGGEPLGRAGGEALSGR
jgi:UDP-N-acetyl-D-mannosaminuronic acid dehydrogenase